MEETTATASLRETDDNHEQAWFDERENVNARRSSPPPPPVEKLGEFLGDPLADAWLR